MKKLLSLAALLIGLGSIAQVHVYVHLDSSVKKSFTGRLYLFTSTDTVRGVPNEPDITNPAPMYSLNVQNWQGNQIMDFDDAARSFSDKLSQLPDGTYSLAAFVDANPDERGLFNPGNYYSHKNVLLHINNHQGEAHVSLDREAKRNFAENDSLKLVNLKSNLLSKFRKQDIYIQAAVMLPSGYNANDAKTYPVVYIIPGWGGTHYDAQGKNARTRYGVGMGLPKIYVYLNPETQSPYGLHAFVDSRVNGPWGQALVEELIPYIQQHFKGSNDPHKTFVMGQSSGGYPSLWLPLHYPKAFGGGWAVSPDPVDFSNFTGVNLYAQNANFYYDSEGKEVPFFLMNGKYLSTIHKAQLVEDFMDNGGQTQAFDAEFGLPDKNGKPVPVFDHQTGRVDPKVVASWKSYDMGLYIQEHWKELSKDLSGKRIHVYAGMDDNFQLNKAVLALKAKAEMVNADIVAELIPDANHFSIWSPTFTARVQKELDELITRAQ